MLCDYIFSVDGVLFLREFNHKFGCMFRMDEPGEQGLVVDIREKSYRIPENESIDRFKKLITDSLHTGINYVEKYYGDNLVSNDDDVIY